jgi:hypothetical protein
MYIYIACLLIVIALIWYMRQLAPVDKVTLIAPYAVKASATLVGESLNMGMGPATAAECAAAAGGAAAALYQAPTYTTGGYGAAGVKKAVPGACLAFKSTEGLSLKSGATPGQTVLARWGSYPPMAPA